MKHNKPSNKMNSKTDIQRAPGDQSQPRPASLGQHSSRRSFLASLAATATISMVPAPLLWARGKPKPAGAGNFRFAQIGCGGRGAIDLQGTIRAGGRLVGLCDVDSVRAKETFAEFPNISKFTDYRRMLDKLDKQIDGVVVATPDHVHAAAALAAIKRGKHVYVEKPLARTFEECQILREAARKHGVVTQMGNQGHSGAGLKLWQMMKDAAAFGEIQHIHVWTHRPKWPQGMTQLPAPEIAPGTLDWQSWLGPQVSRPFASAYLPFDWRGWWDFGCGALGDMACHNMDPAFWIFKLGLPTTIKAQASSPAGIAYPEWSVIDYTFAPTAACPRPIQLTWYDGKTSPHSPPLPPGCHPQLTPGGEGCLIVGSKMSAKGNSHAGAPMLIALGGEPYGKPVKDAELRWTAELKKLTGDNHFGQWIEAALAGKPAAPGSNFEYSAPMTQAVLLGCFALRFPGKELRWDSNTGQFSNCPEANQWLKFQPRAGYSLALQEIDK